MTDIIQNLYNYCNEHITSRYLIDPEYRSYCMAESRAENALKELLPEDGQKLLQDLCDASSDCRSIEMEAAFRAGLAAELELSRV